MPCTSRSLGRDAFLNDRSTYVCVCVCVSKCISVCMYVCMYVYIYIYVWMMFWLLEASALLPGMPWSSRRPGMLCQQSGVRLLWFGPLSVKSIN